MSENIIIPHVGETTTRVRIVRWLKQEGDDVTKGEPVLEVETDKATLEIEAFADGVLEKIVVPEGEEADNMEVVGILSTGEDDTLPPAPKATTPKRIEAPSSSHRSDQVEIPSTRVAASPLARRIAKEHGVDLDQISGSGVNGMIGADDVRDFLETRGTMVATQATSQNADESRMRAAISRQMTLSKTTIPHFYVGTLIRMGEAVKARESLKSTIESKAGVRLSYTHIIAKAIALAARSYPRVNARYQNSGVNLFEKVNLGIAVAVEGGLIVPVLKDTNSKTLSEIATETNRLVQGARKGRLVGSDLEGGTITLSNLGGSEVEFFTAIINPPEVAILAAGEITDRAVVVEGEVIVEPTLYLIGSGDHRVLDGRYLGDFLKEVKRLLEEPYLLFREVA